MKLQISRQEWSEHPEIYTIEAVYRGMVLLGLTGNADLAKKVLSGGYGSRKAERQLALELKQQHGIYRNNRNR
jgi:hypothetical protein